MSLIFSNFDRISEDIMGLICLYIDSNIVYSDIIILSKRWAKLLIKYYYYGVTFPKTIFYGTNLNINIDNTDKLSFIITLYSHFTFPYLTHITLVGDRDENPIINASIAKVLFSINVLSLQLSNFYFDDDIEKTGLKLPISLHELKINFSNNCLDYIINSTYLPDLLSLDCIVNNMEIYPRLSDTVKYINCAGNFLTDIPCLPSTLTFLHCGNNQLSSLPSLPDTLIELYCNVNQLTSLPKLPKSLEKLSCGLNQLSIMPDLPRTLKKLYCSYNPISKLPPLPITLNHLNTNFTQLDVHQQNVFETTEEIIKHFKIQVS